MTSKTWTSQRENTSIDWRNDKQTLNHKNLIDQISKALNIRANQARFWDEDEYQRIMKQVTRLNQVSDVELKQYAIDLNITVWLS